ncbi:uncharacterized protein MONBRDRAFT_34478 [Monosiga brevicollis MX1]|uniref:Regulator of microtubule dynamics protein 1 n=1 Tax=Monosiga brevicollis TaxID=81824 RepID=A9VC04_MONBE|nr:uncharacterized protein MONBRDRAFT_34478 [Monosiga brevicollis MX1]EDQ84895.1 predicted protein [Monosiga brevicollis MX1]|eukprot:XP_001750236.1 hypothetical protein [Monosiga brevicollis MX1]
MGPWHIFAAGCATGAATAGLLAWLRSSPARGGAPVLSEVGQLAAAIAALTQQVQQLDTTISITAPLRNDDDEFQMASDVLRIEAERPPPSHPLATSSGSPMVEVTVRAGSPGPEPVPVVPNHYATADELRDGHKVEEAADYVLQHQQQFLADAEGLWRLCRAYYDKGEIHKDIKQEQLNAAIPRGKDAIAKDPNNARAHKWYAIVQGALSDFVSLQEKLECGMLFRKHVERSLELDPSDALAHHLLGRFCFEVAKLTWFEKQACKTFIGTPPEATYEETLSHFEQADKYQPNWIMNLLFMGKCCVQLGRKADAKRYFRQAAELPAGTPEDNTAQAEARQLM